MTGQVLSADRHFKKDEEKPAAVEVINLLVTQSQAEHKPEQLPSWTGRRDRSDRLYSFFSNSSQGRK